MNTPRPGYVPLCGNCGHKHREGPCEWNGGTKCICQNSVRVLNRRESQVLRLTVRGLTLKEIAAELGISIKTVTVYKTEVYKKAGVSSAAELITKSIGSGLIPVDSLPKFDRAVFIREDEDDRSVSNYTGRIKAAVWTRPLLH